MALPIIAVVGRPNVGKSTLFNKLVGQRLSIVEDTPGVTRDRIYCDAEWNGRQIIMVDTGGIEPRTDDKILAHMRAQAQIAIDTADVIVFMCDVTTGVTAKRSMEAIGYYGGKTAGIAGIYSAVEEVNGFPVRSVYNLKDLPDYETYDAR